LFITPGSSENKVLSLVTKCEQTVDRMDPTATMSILDHKKELSDWVI